MKFTIDRNVWLRGEGVCNSKLLRDDGKMCCVGIFLKALGVMDEDLIDQRVAYDLGIVRLEKLQCPWLAAHGADEPVPSIIELYRTNDSRVMDDADREQLITKEFGKHDVEVEFIN